MATRKLVLEFEFEEEIEDEGTDMEYVHMRPVRVTRTYADPEIDIGALGEEIAQSDRWQVDNWNAIQWVLGGEPNTTTKELE